MCQACSGHNNCKDKWGHSAYMGDWALAANTHSKGSIAPWEHLHGTKGAWKGSCQGSWAGRVHRYFPPPESPDVSGYHQPERSGAHSRERPLGELEHGTLTALLGSESSLLPSPAAWLNNVPDAYLHACFFSRCCWVVSILSLKPWIICILISFEIAFLPLSLHCHQGLLSWAHWLLSLPGKRELSFSPLPSPSPFHWESYIFLNIFPFHDWLFILTQKKTNYWTCHIPRYQPEPNALKNCGKKWYAQQWQGNASLQKFIASSPWNCFDYSLCYM